MPIGNPSAVEQHPFIRRILLGEQDRGYTIWSRDIEYPLDVLER